MKTTVILISLITTIFFTVSTKTFGQESPKWQMHSAFNLKCQGCSPGFDEAYVLYFKLDGDTIQTEVLEFRTFEVNNVKYKGKTITLTLKKFTKDFSFTESYLVKVNLHLPNSNSGEIDGKQTTRSAALEAISKQFALLRNYEYYPNWPDQEINNKQNYLYFEKFEGLLFEK